jgi:hypothetical protein
MFEQKFVDGTPVPQEYLDAVQPLIAAAAEAEELIPQEELEAYAALSDYERYVRERLGYSEVVEIHGSMGWTELGMHTGYCDTPAKYALCQPGRYNYAYVLLDHPTKGEVWTYGCFHRFDDGTFSLS